MAASEHRTAGGTRVIFNADDFGRSSAINAAVIQAHCAGVLTSTSLMVTGDAVEEAVTLARAAPTLAVGLHVIVIDGPALLPPSHIPHLVNAGGCFPEDAFAAGVRYAVSRAARAELSCELAAQFERFAATGLPLSHVDGHAHMHLLPAVWDLVLPLAEQYGASGIRLPRDDLRLALRYGRQRRASGRQPVRVPSNAAGAATQLVWAAIFGALCRWCTGRLRNRRLAITERVYGLMQTGQMEETYVLEVLRSLHVATAELYFHPTTAPQSEALGPNPGDLATLLSPAVGRAMVQHNLHLATYPALRRQPGGDVTCCSCC